MSLMRNRPFIIALVIISISMLVLAPASAGGGIAAGPWRDINPTQFLTAGDASVPGPDVPFNGIYVRVAGFGAVGAGEAWAVGGCGPTAAGPPVFPFLQSGCSPPAAGGGGTISYYDGFSWTIKTDPYNGHSSFYTGVNFCTSPGSPSVSLCGPNGDGTDGWIVGGNATGQVALYVPSPSVGPQPDSAGLTETPGAYLTSVFETCHVDNDPNGKGCPSGSLAGDAYAAGTDGAGDGVIYEYTGSAPFGGSWALVHTSSGASKATIYNSIYMFIDSTGNVEGFAVGDNGVIARFYSGSWVDSTVGTSATTFHGVAIDSANPADAWAVGCVTCSTLPFSTLGGVIYHFTSGSWSGPLSPSPVNGVILMGVDVLSTSEAWIVGTNSTILHGTGLPGSSFQSVSTAGSNVLDSGTGVGIDLNSVSFQSSSNGWAVGTHGVILQTSDSSCDSIVQTSSPSACWGGQTSIEQTTQFRAVYENNPSDAWAGGLYDTNNNFPSLIHWDGNKWHRATVVPGLGGVSKPDIYGIYMVGGSEGYAVGAQNSTEGATCGVANCPAAFTWNVVTPNTWQAVGVTQCSSAPATGCGMRSVYFASIGSIDGWAVGLNGAIWTYSKSNPKWVFYGSPVTANLNAVFINNPGNNNPAGWAVGDDGTILWLNCSSGSCVWNAGSVPGLSPTINLEGIYFTDQNHGWIVGADNTIITTVNNGGVWAIGSASNIPATGASWISVHVDTYGTTSGSGDGWAVGFDGSGNALTAHWDGASWTNLPIPYAVTSGLGLYSVFTTSPTDGWAVGAQPSIDAKSLTGIFHLDPITPPVVGQQATTNSTSSSATSTSSVASSTSSTPETTSVTTTSSMTTTVVSTSVSTMTVVNTPTTSSTTIAVSTPMVLPAIPGFPWESIIAGLMIGLTTLAIIRRRRT